MCSNESAAVRQHGGSATEAAGSPPHPHCITFRPVALAVWKRGRWCVVAKCVPLTGEPVLAVAVRHQIGTNRAVSLPLCVIDYAEAAGCRWFVRRDDREHSMGRLLLADLRRVGWLGADGEQYVKLSDLAPVPWRSWQYVENTVRLSASRQAAAQQPEALRQGGLW